MKLCPPGITGLHIMSLPTRERELKLENSNEMRKEIMSLPTRERELKPRMGGRRTPATASLPTRERDLKHVIQAAKKPPHGSLPTRERELKPRAACCQQTAAVAPHAGARIETPFKILRLQKSSSLPTRERELKPCQTPRAIGVPGSLPRRERDL